VLLAFALTPQALLIIVAVIAVARIAITLQPVKVGAGGEADSRARNRTFAREYLDPFIYAGIGAFILITFVARTYYIPSASMVPTLQVGDVLLVNKFEYRFHAPNEQDIVVFPPPVATEDDFIKRVIGRPGDTLRIRDGIVYLNGKALTEPYIKERPQYNLEIRNYNVYVDSGAGYQPLDPTAANIPPRSQWSAPDRIPANCYFMMGDNRNDSEDSHIWGFAQNGGTFASGQRAGESVHFTGHAFFTFWPITHLKLLWH